MKLHIANAETALRLGSCPARLDLVLPAHFHALPVDDQNREIELAAGRAASEMIDALAIHRSVRRSA